MSTDTSSVLKSEAPSHEIIIASSLAERQQCLDIRIEVFHREQKFPLETEIDDLEDQATHFLLRLIPSLTPIGTIRGFRVPNKSYYKLTRLAILKDYRKYRLGRELVLALHNWVMQDCHNHTEDTASENPRTTPSPTTVDIVTHSQLYIKPFYAKFGYEPEGDEFDEDGDPHQKMVLRLPV
ncbi:acyl-CoA N-acyltransferase [Crepidotus variabilis]|uniref:Acyl-CoA N-acyltransferase n=1 Tax=Crepidotus variabilis TaxID=179855 RepID=A0A9P6ESN8_9AGAR|nr:acyl-CoA N-acyltransferase [Crepidotus variabilis]